MSKLRNNYSNIKDFGCNVQTPANDPLTYCLGSTMDQKFAHGSSADNITGQSSRNCQMYLADYCSQGWDQFCEFASQNKNISFPNSLDGLGFNTVGCGGLNAGEVLILNSARRKYLNSMGSCQKVWEPFDLNVPNSPMISYYVQGGSCGDTSCSGSCGFNSSCIPTYAVDIATVGNLDTDPIMNKILDQPGKYPDFVINMYNTMKRMGTLQYLEGTRLGNYFSTNPYFRNKGGLNKI
jgi:hypothetical protein